MGKPSEHIAAWEAAGLIDKATADRLRAASVTEVPTPTGRTPSMVTAMFGPSVTIPELFGYLGSAFLLAGWTVFMGRPAAAGDDTSFATGIGAAIAAGVLLVVGLVLRRGDARRSRAAGVAFLAAVAYAGWAVTEATYVAGLERPLAAVLGCAAALALAIGVRWLHAAVLTQIAVLGALTAQALTTFEWARNAVVPEPTARWPSSVVSGGPDPVVLLVVSAIWWLAWALLMGFIGLLEARDAAAHGDAAAARRAAVSRLWAGVVAVVGLASAVMATDYRTWTGERVLEPWIGDLALVLLSLVLLERAFRRDATAYVYAAALGLIIALSDFNFTYLSNSTEVGLVIEGLILLAVGVGADRLRRRVGRPGAGSGTDLTHGAPTGPAQGVPA